VRRARHILLILFGRVPEATLARMEFDMAFEKTTAAIEELKLARDKVVATLQASEAAVAGAAQLQADAQTADDNTAAAITEVTTSLQNAVPPSA
jgi:hypothetical protein